MSGLWICRRRRHAGTTTADMPHVFLFLDAPGSSAPFQASVCSLVCHFVILALPIASLRDLDLPYKHSTWLNTSTCTLQSGNPAQLLGLVPKSPGPNCGWAADPQPGRSWLWEPRGSGRRSRQPPRTPSPDDSYKFSTPFFFGGAEPMSKWQLHPPHLQSCRCPSKNYRGMAAQASNTPTDWRWLKTCGLMMLPKTKICL